MLLPFGKAGRLSLEQLEDRSVLSRPLPYPVIYTGVETSSPPAVKGFDAETGELTFERTAYESAFTGGVRVATGDVTGDGYPDLVVTPGAGGGPRVRVLDGKTGEQISGQAGSFWAFDKSFNGGVEVAAADVNGDGTPDVIAAAGPGGGPHVRVFSGKDGTQLHSFFAYEPEFRGGVFVGTDALAGDVTGDGVADLVVGPGVGRAPDVKVYNGATGKLVRQTPVFDPGVTAGVRVAKVALICSSRKQTRT
jgi:hypothetical protein